MSMNLKRQNLAYGLNNPLQGLNPETIKAKRAPVTSDMAEVGTIWINRLTSDSWVLTKIVSNAASWTPITVVNGAVISTGNLTVTVGNIVATAGNIRANGGDIVAAGEMACDGDFTTTAGDITATLGDITATVGDVIAGSSVFVAGDAGAGDAGSLGLTNDIEDTLSSGVLSITGTTASTGANAGFIKIYVGVTEAWIPYFTDISPT